MTGWVVIGLMSGTSVDGIDAALVQSDGTHVERLHCDGFFAYRPETRSGIWRAVADPMALLNDRLARQTLERLIAEDHATAVRSLVSKTRHRPSLIGFHGQTIYHNPDLARAGNLEHATVQLGDAALLAKLTGINVVYDVRRADMVAGGEGAPLAPVYHRAVFDQLGTALPSVLVNIGGVSNLTFYDGADTLIGFDTGPGNALMDDYMRRHCNAEFDRGGALAASGTADQALVDQWMQHAYFDRDWPKSLDRQMFRACLDSPRLRRLSAADAMASLTCFTGRSIAHAIARLPATPRHVMLAGGGRHNACLYANLQGFIGPALDPPDCDELAFSSDMLEAELIAFLAARHCAGLPTSFPSTTGCRQPVCGGRLMRSD